MLKKKTSQLHRLLVANNMSVPQTIVFVIVLISLASSIIYVAWSLVLAPSGTEAAAMTEETKSHFTLMLLQCILGLLVIWLPSIIEKQLKVEIPTLMGIVILVFLFCAIFLGEVRNFYYRFEYWDTFLHALSGLMIGAIGFSVVNLLHTKNKVSLTPAFIALFAFCFAMAIDGIWEIYEYVFDGILGLNMQKFATETGQLLVGRAALADTMEDLIVDFFGALAMAIIGYVSLKFHKHWLRIFLIKRQGSNEDLEDILSENND